MPQVSSPGGAWNEEDKAHLVREVMSGALSVSEACARHGLSQECIRDWLLMFRHSAIEAFDEHLRQTLVPQGIDVRDGPAARFNGSLSDISLADLIQTLTLARRDGVITILQEGLESRIWCAAGEIVDAESGRLQGEPALYRALALKSGRVIAEFVPVSRVRTIFEGPSSLLLNGARRMDECNVILERCGPSRYRLGAEVASLETSLGTAEQTLLEQFNVPSTLRAALARSELGDLEALSLISRWIEHGWLRVEAEPSPVLSTPRALDAGSTAPMMLSFLRPSEQRAPARRRLQESLGVGAAGFAALGVVGWLAFGSFFGAPGTKPAAPAAAARGATWAPAAPAPEAEQATAAMPPPVAKEPVRAEPPAPVIPVAPSAVVPSAAIPSAAVPAVGATSVTRRRPHAPVTLAPSAERAPSRAVPSAAPDTESTPRSAPHMQIIDEQTPHMQIVE